MTIEGSIIRGLTACALAMTLAACTDDNATTDGGADGQQLPIVLSATLDGYADRQAAATRSGQTAIIDYSVLARNDYGFGVFAYGTDTDWLNRRVTYQGSESNPVEELDPLHMHPGNWVYEGTTEYWADKTVSFLAYAPFVGTSGNSYSAPAETGITSVSGSSMSDTQVGYAIGDKPSEGVDLLWAINDQTKLPWLNCTKATTPQSGTVLLSFHHALAAIGMRVQANDDDHILADGTGEGFRITIRELTLSGPFLKSGTLNLNSSTAVSAGWGNQSTARWVSTTAFDPATKTLSVPNGEVAPTLRHPDSDVAGNIGDDVTTATTVMSTADGVGTTQQLLIAGKTLSNSPAPDTSTEQCLLVIPDKAEHTFTVNLTWCVCSRFGTTYAKVFEKTFTQDFTLALLPETKYYLDFNFTLNDVSVKVTAHDWTTELQNATIITEQGTSANESLARQR